MSTKLHTPVLIVGGGPVGLSLALDLTWRGIECMLVEKTDGSVNHPKTGHIAIRTMEFCRRWGIAERVRNCGFPDDYRLNVVFCTSLCGHQLARRDYPTPAEDKAPPQSPEKKQRAPQMYFDPILAAAVREQEKAEVRYRTELLSFVDRGENVVSQIRDLSSGSELTVESRYLVACDGPGSMVRQSLGLHMEGDGSLSYSVAIYFRCPNLTKLHNMGEAVRYVFLGSQGVWGNLTVVDGNEFWRLTILGSQDKIDAGTFDAEGWVRQCMGSESIPFEIVSILPWRRSRLVANRFSSGRVHLAGDAVHTMSPTGGFGFNTGICDAIDLGWKLEAMLRGWGGAKLLESYDAERRPVGGRNADAAADNFNKLRALSNAEIASIVEESDEGRALRAQIGESIAESTRKESESTGIILGYRYEGSPIIVSDGTPEPYDDPQGYVQTSRPGHRAPHAWIKPGQSTLDLFGRGFVLLRFGADAPDPQPILDAAKRVNLPLSLVNIANAGIAQLYERRLVIVRPDGHTAWRGDNLPADPGAIIDIVRGVGR